MQKHWFYSKSICKNGRFWVGETVKILTFICSQQFNFKMYAVLQLKDLCFDIIAQLEQELTRSWLLYQLLDLWSKQKTI